MRVINSLVMCIYMCFRRRRDFVNYVRKLVEGFLEEDDIEIEVLFFS